MKKLALMGCSLMVAASMAAAESADTLTVKATDVVIVETPSGVSVTLQGSEKNPDYSYTLNAEYPDGTSVSTVKDESEFNFDFPFTKRKQQKGGRLSVGMGPILLGFVGGTGLPADVKVNMGRSLEASFHSLLGVRYSIGPKLPDFSLGFGLTLRQYVAKNSGMYVMTPDKTVGITTFPEESYDRSSKFSCFNIQFPLTVSQPLGGDWRFSVSASLDIITNCTIYHSYKIGEEEYSYKWSSVPARTVNYSLLGALTYEGNGIYCKWSPKGIVKEGFGPQFGTISVGLTVGF